MKNATMKRTLNIAMLLALTNAAMLGGRPIPDTVAGSHTGQAVQLIDSETVVGGGDWRKWALCALCVGGAIATPVIGPTLMVFGCGFVCGYAAAEA